MSESQKNSSGEIVLIDDIGLYTQVAYVQNNALRGFKLEAKTTQHRVNDIFLAKVERVISSLNAAFVDIGTSKSAFLPLDKPSSASTVHPGHLIIVQLKRLPTATKAARVTTDISLSKSALVFRPNGNEVAVSNRVPNKAEKRRLRKSFIERLANSSVLDSGGFILRSNAIGISLDALCEQAEELIQEWTELQTRSGEQRTPHKLKAQLSLLQSVLADAHADVHAHAHAGPSSYYLASLDDLIETEDQVPSGVTHFGVQKSLFADFGIQGDIDALVSRTVDLPSGASLCFDQHEGLCSIDVNSSSAVELNARGDAVQSAIKRINSEAAKMIALQLRLRNLGGLVVIDFINMESLTDQIEVRDLLAAELKLDPAPTQVGDFSEFGLLEMQRARIGEDLASQLQQVCNDCSGSGWVASSVMVANQIFKELVLSAQKEAGVQRYTIKADSAVIQLLELNYTDQLKRLSQRFDCELTLSPNARSRETLYDIVLR